MSSNTETLESMCELIVDCPHSTPKWTDNGVIVLRNQYIKNGRLDLSDPSHTDEVHYQKRIKRAEPQAGDIVFTREAPMGEVCMIPEGVRCCLGQRQVLLRPKNGINGKYLLFALQSPRVQHEISWNEGTGSTVSNVRIPVLKNLNIPRHPNYEEEIAEILNSLSEKIELNRQINQTLEHIAQAIFKSWFVDFEPVKAKIQAKQNGQDLERAAMCAISGKTDTERDAFLKASTPEHDAQGSANVAGGRMPGATRQQLTATAALFPDELEDSELGLIPKGWAWKPLYETAGYVNGSAFKASDFSEDAKGLPIIKIAELKQGISAGTKFTRGNFREKYKIHDGDVLYSWSGSPETSLEVFKWFGGEGWLNQHIFKLNFVSKYQKYFAYFLLRYMKPVLIRTAQQKQTTGLGHVTVADMKRIKVPYPDEIMLEMFSSVVGPIYEQASCLQKQMNTLSSLRDSLLPKLLSGEITLGDAQTARADTAC
ncbi:MAG: restriction endonuclease subunit S [Gammaproteobacteria bacterium]|nr:restriction endonuclease subunit S [Gammaproteobacteria bacterium]